MNAHIKFSTKIPLFQIQLKGMNIFLMNLFNEPLFPFGDINLKSFLAELATEMSSNPVSTETIFNQFLLVIFAKDIFVFAVDFYSVTQIITTVAKYCLLSKLLTVNCY